MRKKNFVGSGGVYVGVKGGVVAVSSLKLYLFTRYPVCQ